jgi:hemerythrin superfamily protein
LEERLADQASGRDVIDELVADHREALDLLAQIAKSADPQEKREYADTVITEVVRHSVAEEMYVYPAMREHLPDGDEAVEHDVEEHKDLEQVMKELERADASDARFDELVQEMTDKLSHHAHDEEDEQFPKLRQHVPHDKLVELREKVDTAKKLAPTRPHPGAPNSEVFHKLVGPGVGLVDRARDRLTGRSTTS